MLRTFFFAMQSTRIRPAARSRIGMKNCTFNWSTCCNVEGILTHRESLEFPSRRLRCSVQRKRYTQRTERDGEYEKINKNKSRRKLSHVNYKSSFIAIRSVSFGGRFFFSLQFCWSLFFFSFFAKHLSRTKYDFQLNFTGWFFFSLSSQLLVHVR